MKTKSLLLFLLFLPSLSFSQKLDQSFIAVKSSGVQEFLEEHSEYDGRGTLILILDSGVDIGIDGLTTTSTGEPKVIDVQDFSGEGDFYFTEAEVDEENDSLIFYSEEKDIKVKAAQDYLLKNDDDYFIGVIDEKHWINSSAKTYDLNNNGKTDDNFVFLVYKPDDSENWVVYLDTNNDGKLDDENPIRNFKINRDAFTIKTEFDEPQYTIGLNVFPGEKKVTFHYDAVAHGSHCAGIATGNKIGNDEFYGVAPGANLGSLKIGSSIYSGGSTTIGSMKAAYDYADKLTKELDMPVIINMSYGIGSEIHAQSDMEEYLDNLVSANPYLYISLSAGNEGPGISTIGLPSSSSSIFCSGATLAKEVGNDLYGAPLDKDVILHFSSRGGEVNKPDLVSPGAATSTVPYWTRGDRFWGTSMASPYTAGVMSLLLSAMKVEHPDVKIPSLLLYKAMRESAVLIEGYDPVDQGGGMINVVGAYNLLKKYIDAGEIEKFETYKISADAPSTPSGTAQNLYIRNGSYLTGVEKFTFEVKRGFFNKSDKYFRTYRIKSESDWLIPITTKTYIRNDQKAAVIVRLDKSKMTEPGLYSGKIKANRADNSNFPEFEMLATVVIPIHFNDCNNYEMKENGKLAPAEVKRFFLEIPPAATSMKINLSYDEGDYANTWYSLHDPEGRGVGSIRALESEKDEREEENIYYDLTPGVYELDLVGHYTAVDSVNYNLSVQFESLQISGDNYVDSLDNTLSLINNYNNVLRCSLSGELLGYEKDYTIRFSDSEIMQHTFTFNEDEKEKFFNFTLKPEDFNTVTDFSAMIYNSDGKALSVKSFSYKDLSVSLFNSFDDTESKFTLELVPAFVDEVKPITVFVNEQTTVKEPAAIKVTNKGSAKSVFYPAIAETLILDIDFSENKFETGEQPFGKIYFESQNNGKVEYELPIYINF